MTDSTIIKKVSRKFDEKILNSKYKRFLNYSKSKRKILKEIRTSLGYVLVDYLEKINVKIIDIININKIVIYIELTDKELNNKINLYYEFRGDI